MATTYNVRVNFADLRPGDRVTIIMAKREYRCYGWTQEQRRSGVVLVHLCNPLRGSVLLKMAGADSTPAVCTSGNFVKALRKIAGPRPIAKVETKAKPKTRAKGKSKPKRKKRKVRSVWTIPGGGIETNRRRH